MSILQRKHYKGIIIDTNVYLSRWSFRHLHDEDPPRIWLPKLRKENVLQSWVGSFDGMLHWDIADVNIRLA